MKERVLYVLIPEELFLALKMIALEKSISVKKLIIAILNDYIKEEKNYIEGDKNEQN